MLENSPQFEQLQIQYGNKSKVSDQIITHDWFIFNMNVNTMVIL